VLVRPGAGHKSLDEREDKSVAAKTAPIETSPAMLIGRWEKAGYKLAALAEELPAEAYEFRPADGVRTAGDVLRHVAFWNRYVAAVARGNDFDDTANELPRAEYPTKAKIVAALRKSIADAVAALKESGPEKEPGISELVATFLEHSSEHYGQLVVYTRMKGTVPPASRT
jgi:uncharacterized damage-inducible protein DinB